MAKTSIPREEKGGGRKRGRGAWEKGVLQSGRQRRETEGVRGYLWCPRRGSKYP